MESLRSDIYQGSKGKLPQTDRFQFIDLSVRSREVQARNRTLVRSHVIKAARRANQKKQEDLRRLGLVEFTFLKGHTSQDELDSMTDDAIRQFFRTSTWTLNSARLSHRPALESTISALQTYKGKVTPYLYELLGNCKAYIH
jgi:hypothetical protein